VTGKVDAVELFGFARRLDGPRTRAWYRFLNCGYRVPLVGGTDKISAGMAMGAVRTYAEVGADKQSGFAGFAEAVRAGRTFITSGPLVVLRVEGETPGATLRVARNGATLDVVVEVDSVQPLEQVELVMNGSAVVTWDVTGSNSARLSTQVRVDRSSWLAARVKGRGAILAGYPTAIQAHTSPVYVQCGSTDSAYSLVDAQQLLTMIQGGAHWLANIATVESGATRDRMLATMRKAEQLLTARMARHR
jgi:hypothetical protein